MRIASFVFAILAGCLGAGLVVMGGNSLWLAALAYSLVGSVALVLSLVVAAYWRPLIASTGSLVAREAP